MAALPFERFAKKAMQPPGFISALGSQNPQKDALCNEEEEEEKEGIWGHQSREAKPGPAKPSSCGS